MTRNTIIFACLLLYGILSGQHLMQAQSVQKPTDDTTSIRANTVNISVNSESLRTGKLIKGRSVLSEIPVSLGFGVRQAGKKYSDVDETQTTSSGANRLPRSGEVRGLTQHKIQKNQLPSTNRLSLQ